MFQKIADGRTDLVFSYLAEGHAATSADKNGVTLIKWCAYHGDVSAIRLLIQKGESLKSLGDNYGLFGAAFHGHWQLCQFVLENGADANQPLTETGESPLHMALSTANRPNYNHVVEILLKHGADPNVKTKANKETGCFMRDCYTKAETALHRAAAFGTIQVIQLLLEAGANRETKDIDGNSPLSWASWHLRSSAILKALCYNEHFIHPDNNSDYDHGMGWSQTDQHMLGRPHFDHGPGQDI